MKTTLKNRLLYLFMAFVFALGTLFICFRPLNIKTTLTAYADVDTDESMVLDFDGTPYSTFLKSDVTLLDSDVSTKPFDLAGSNFQIDNNFRLDQEEWSYYFYSNRAYGVNGVPIYHIPFIVGYYVNSDGVLLKADNFCIEDSEGDTDYIFDSFYYTDSLQSDMSVLKNYYSSRISINDLNSDKKGYYASFLYGYHSYFFAYSSTGYVTCFDLYATGYFSTVSKVTVTNSKFPFTIFKGTTPHSFQGIPEGNAKPDSITFTYYGIDESNYFSVNVYSYRSANQAWNTKIRPTIPPTTYTPYNYNRTYYLLPPDFGDNEAYRSGYDEGYNNGYDEGYDIGSAEFNDGSYDIGYNDGLDVGYDKGYDDGYSKISTESFNRGKEVGYAEGVASKNDYSFLSLMGAVVDAPIKALTGLLNFEILGFNLASFFYALVTIAIIIFVIRLVLAK